SCSHTVSRLNVPSSSQCYVGKTTHNDQRYTCHGPHDNSRNQVISNYEKNQSEQNYWTSHTERDLGLLLAKDIDDSYAAHYSDQRSYDGHKVQLTTCCLVSSVRFISESSLAHRSRRFSERYFVETRSKPNVMTR